LIGSFCIVSFLVLDVRLSTLNGWRIVRDITDDRIVIGGQQRSPLPPDDGKQFVHNCARGPH